MSTSDADKPPICSPAPAVAPPSGPLVPVPSVGQEIVDAVALPARQVHRPSIVLHRMFLGIAIVVVAASVSLSIRDHDRVIVPIINTPLPGTCTFRKMTGMPCPGCGLTRSFISMGHGQFRDAWNYNPAGFFFFAVVAFQIPYRIYQIVRVRRGREHHRFVWIDNWVLIALVIVLIIQWIWGVLSRIA